jgi:hypothetical protein
MKLTIDIACKKETCGKCKLVVRASRGTACGLYVKVLDSVKNDYKRLPECIAACNKQKQN